MIELHHSINTLHFSKRASKKDLILIKLLERYRDILQTTPEHDSKAQVPHEKLNYGVYDVKYWVYNKKYLMKILTMDLSRHKVFHEILNNRLPWRQVDKVDQGNMKKREHLRNAKATDKKYCTLPCLNGKWPWPMS